MEITVFQRLQKNLLQKRKNLTGWLNTTPPPRKQVQLGTAGERQIQDHLHSLDTALQKVGDKTLGVCTVCHELVDTHYLEMDYTACVCLEHLSPQERHSLETELEFLQIVQKALLPQQAPSFPDLELAAFSRPAQIVGGDYFDFFQYHDSGYGLAIADAMGHGVSASMIMSSLQAALRALLPENISPQEVLQRVNRVFLHNTNFTTFISVFLAHYDPVAHSLTYCNAGHNPPLFYRAGNRQVDWLRPTGAAIGLVEEHQYQANQLQLAQGDILLLYTDGVTEAVNSRQEVFGSQRLAELVRSNAHLAAQELLRAVRQGWVDFMGDRTADDDVTLVIGKVNRIGIAGAV